MSQPSENYSAIHTHNGTSIVAGKGSRREMRALVKEKGGASAGWTMAASKPNVNMGDEWPIGPKEPAPAVESAVATATADVPTPPKTEPDPIPPMRKCSRCKADIPLVPGAAAISDICDECALNDEIAAEEAAKNPKKVETVVIPPTSIEDVRKATEDAIKNSPPKEKFPLPPIPRTKPKPKLPEKMVPVQSSTIVSLGFDREVLFVEFETGFVYYYENVPEKIYRLLLDLNTVNLMDDAGISIGSLFHYLLKIHPDKYPATKW